MKKNICLVVFSLCSMVVFAPYKGHKDFDKSLLEKPIRDLTKEELRKIAERFEAQQAVTDQMTPAQQQYELNVIERKNAARLQQQRHALGK